VLELIDLVKNLGNGNIFSEQVKISKNEKMRRKLMQNFSKLYRKLILGFQKSALVNPLKPPNRGSSNLLFICIDQTICYFVRVEHKKCSKICIRIVRFGLKLRKWDHC